MKYLIFFSALLLLSTSCYERKCEDGKEGFLCAKNQRKKFIGHYTGYYRNDVTMGGTPRKFNISEGEESNEMLIDSMYLTISCNSMITYTPVKIVFRNDGNIAELLCGINVGGDKFEPIDLYADGDSVVIGIHNGRQNVWLVGVK
jgi:hypothetical protein